MQNEQQTQDFDAAFGHFAGTDASDEAAHANPPAASEAAQPEVSAGQPAADAHTPPATDAAAPQTATPTIADLLAALPDHLRPVGETLVQERDQFRHRAHSDAGRLAALTRKLNQQQAAGQAPAATPQPQSPAATPAAGQHLAELREVFPELAAALEQDAAARQQEMAQLRQEATEPVRQLQHEQYLASQFAALEAAHPDWQQTVQQAEFGQWLQQQPRALQNMMQSEDASEAGWLLGQFKQYRQQAAQASSAVRQQQQQRLQQGVALPSKGNPASSAPPEDFDNAFDYYSQRR